MLPGKHHKSLKKRYLNTVNVSHLSPLETLITPFCLTFHDLLFLDLVYSLYVNLDLKINSSNGYHTKRHVKFIGSLHFKDSFNMLSIVFSHHAICQINIT